MRPQDVSAERMNAHRAHIERRGRMARRPGADHVNEDDLTDGERRAIRRRGGLRRQLAMEALHAPDHEKQKEALAVASLKKSIARYGSVRSRPEIIIAVTAKHYGLRTKTLLGSSREHKISRARQVCMYLMSELTRLSAGEVAHRCGRTDHTTALHARKRIDALMAVDAELRAVVERLKRLVAS